MVLRLAAPKSAPEGLLTSKAVVEGGGLASALTSWQGTISSHPPFAITKLSVEPIERTRVSRSNGVIADTTRTTFRSVWLSTVKVWSILF
jgi:hypothetical protein